MIAQHQTLVRVEQAKALMHMFQRRVEVTSRLFQPVLIFLEPGHVAGDLGIAKMRAGLVMDAFDGHMRPETGAVLAHTPAFAGKFAAVMGDL